MALRFGSGNELDYNEIRRVTRQELRKRSLELGDFVKIGEFRGFISTPNKDYTAKAEAKVSCPMGSLGDGTITVVLFRPGDGTGNRTSGYVTDGVPTKWAPRRKRGHAEIFMTIGTGQKGEWYPGRNNLLLADYSIDEDYALLAQLTMGQGPHIDLLNGIGSVEFF